MSFELPQKLKPAWDFGVQVIVGALMFLVVFLVAVGISFVVNAAERTGFVPAPVATAANYAELALFCVDLFCFGLFLMSEVIKFVRALWRG